MEATLTKSFIDIRASRGIVRNYSLSTPTTKFDGSIVEPVTDFRILDRMVRNDEVISAAFDLTVDMVSRNGFDFFPKGETEVSKKEAIRAEKKFTELAFSNVLDNIVYSMLYYGDCFLELRRKKGKGITELHVLETTEMRIVHNEHGEIGAYVQRPFDTTNFTLKDIENKESEMGIWFKPKDVVHFTMKEIGSTVYSQTPLEPVARVWATKMRANDYLLQAFTNLPPELFIHMKKASEKDRDDFMQMLQRRKQMAGFIPVTYGSEDSAVEIKEVGFDPKESGVLAILQYLREQILMITRVPPLMLGVTAQTGANRGNAEGMIFSYETKIRKIQQKVQDKLNLELMPALKFNSTEFNFNPVSARGEKETVENAAVFKSMNVKPEAIVKYLKRNGITDITTDDFEDPLEQMTNNNQTATNLTAPSRKSEDKFTDKMTSRLNTAGVSEAGKAKLDERSIKQR